MKLNHPQMYDANGAHLSLANIPAQWYTLPAEGYEEHISAIESPTIIENIEPIIHPHIITTGPPVLNPYGKRTEQHEITETAVKLNEKDMKALNPL